MRGPFPRGQCVQFDKCNHSILTDFSCENSNASWTEDNINVYESNNVTIRRGLIDGNNSPSGDGVMVESSGIPGLVTTGLVDSVDAIRQGNGCFGGWGVSNVIFANVRAGWTHCTGWSGRAKPSSNSLVFAGGQEGKVQSAGLQIVNSTYSSLCVKNLVWPSTAFSKIALTEAPFVPRAPVRLHFCWSSF
jgi:hypothetical protein